MEVMTTLHGSTPSLWRRVEGCVLPKGMIVSARDPFNLPILFIELPSLYRLSLDPIRILFLHVGVSVGFQSWFSSDRFSYLRSSLLCICSEFDINLSTSRLPSCIVDRCLL